LKTFYLINDMIHHKNLRLKLKTPVILYLIYGFLTECFYQQMDTIWETKPSMSICRTFHSMTVCGGNILFMGGSTGRKSEFRDTASVEMYNLQAERYHATID